MHTHTRAHLIEYPRDKHIINARRVFSFFFAPLVDTSLTHDKEILFLNCRPAITHHISLCILVSILLLVNSIRYMTFLPCYFHTWVNTLLIVKRARYNTYTINMKVLARVAQLITNTKGNVTRVVEDSTRMCRRWVVPSSLLNFPFLFFFFLLH